MPTIRFILLAIMFYLFSSGAELAAAQLRSSFSLKERTQQVAIDYPDQPGGDRFAQYALRKTSEFIPSAERFLGIPFPGLNEFKILVCNKCGSMDEKTVKIGHSDKNAPALLYHELGHFWYGYAPGHTKREWLIEGIVSFLPMAMHETGFLKLNVDESNDLIDGWMFRGVLSKNDDKPINVWNADYYYRYAKSYKVQYIISRELGYDTYRAFLRSVVTEKPQNDSEIVTLLNKHKRMDWCSFLSGWVFPGEYRVVGMEDFLDHDNDGLLSVEERYLGTLKNMPDSDGDGYGDGWERNNGHDPLDRASPPGMDFPVVDGTKDRIKKSKVFVHADPRGDGSASSDISGSEVHLIEGGEHDIFFRAEFCKNEMKPSFHTVHLRSDDGRNFWIQTKNPVATLWIMEFADGVASAKWKKSNIDTHRIKAAYADLYELSISSNDFGLHNSFSIRYYSGGYNGLNEKWDSDATEFIHVKMGY